MKKFSTQFINELGNDIHIEVFGKEIEGIPGIYLSIQGPSSTGTEHITLKEAQELYTQLGAALNIQA